MLKKILNRKPWHFIFIGVVVIFGMATIIGSGNNDDEGQVTVRNFDDDHDYHVELFRASDNVAVSSFILDDYDPLDPDSSNTFENIDEGDYYLVIRFKNDSVDVVRDQSRVFELDEGETECFEIEDDGDIDDC
jgi:hypothetical protein